MLTEWEVLAELERIGISEPALVNSCLKEFEEYIEMNHGIKIIKKEKGESEKKQ
jgi:hypothetical protein